MRAQAAVCTHTSTTSFTGNGTGAAAKSPGSSRSHEPNTLRTQRAFPWGQACLLREINYYSSADKTSKLNTAIRSQIKQSCPVCILRQGRSSLLGANQTGAAGAACWERVPMAGAGDPARGCGTAGILRHSCAWLAAGKAAGEVHGCSSTRGGWMLSFFRACAGHHWPGDLCHRRSDIPRSSVTPLRHVSLAPARVHHPAPA